MATTKSRRPIELVSIPAVPILRDRLSHVLAESRRLRILIRTARELELIDVGAGDAADCSEVTP